MDKGKVIAVANQNSNIVKKSTTKTMRMIVSNN